MMRQAERDNADDLAQEKARLRKLYPLPVQTKSIEEVMMDRGMDTGIADDRSWMKSKGDV